MAAVMAADTGESGSGGRGSRGSRRVGPSGSRSGGGVGQYTIMVCPYCNRHLMVMTAPRSDGSRGGRDVGRNVRNERGESIESGGSPDQNPPETCAQSFTDERLEWVFRHVREK